MSNKYTKAELIQMGWGAYLKDRQGNGYTVAELCVEIDGQGEAQKDYDYECDTNAYASACRVEDGN